MHSKTAKSRSNRIKLLKFIQTSETRLDYFKGIFYQLTNQDLSKRAQALFVVFTIDFG